jgi:hypothetical protein
MGMNGSVDQFLCNFNITVVIYADLGDDECWMTIAG